MTADGLATQYHYKSRLFLHWVGSDLHILALRLNKTGILRCFHPIIHQSLQSLPRQQDNTVVTSSSFVVMVRCGNFQLLRCHDDVMKWKYFPRYWPFVREFTGEFPSQRPATRSFDFFSLISAWINGLINNREAGDLRQTPSRSLWRHCITIMLIEKCRFANEHPIWTWPISWLMLVFVPSPSVTYYL